MIVTVNIFLIFVALMFLYATSFIIRGVFRLLRDDVNHARNVYNSWRK